MGAINVKPAPIYGATFDRADHGAAYDWSFGCDDLCGAGRVERSGDSFSDTRLAGMVFILWQFRPCGINSCGHWHAGDNV